MKILAFAESRGGQFKKIAAEAVAAARSIADRTGGTVIALAVGSETPSNVELLSGADELITVADARLADYSVEAVSRAVATVAQAEGADAVFLGHSQHGKDLGPRVAVLNKSAYIPDIVTVDHDGDWTFTRPVYAGKGRAVVKPKTSAVVASLRPNVFVPSGNGSAPPPRSVDVEFAETDFRSTVVETRVASGVKDVADAEVVVSGGRGLKGPENFHLVEELAAALDGAVGASRAVVDAGWRPHSEQVGQTGKTVSPSLYVACAISGAVQHLAGMSSSKVIVAINKDAEAPIFSIADYGIVGDVFEILPQLTEAIRATG